MTDWTHDPIFDELDGVMVDRYVHKNGEVTKSDKSKRWTAFIPYHRTGNTFKVLAQGRLEDCKTEVENWY